MCAHARWLIEFMSAYSSRVMKDETRDIVTQIKTHRETSNTELQLISLLCLL